MNTAVTVSNGRIAPCFPGVDLWIVRDNELQERATRETKDWSIVHWAPELMRDNVQVLLCSGIDRFLHGVLLGYGIQVMPDVVGDASEALAEWIASGEGDVPLCMRHHGLRGCRRERLRGRLRHRRRLR